MTAVVPALVKEANGAAPTGVRDRSPAQARLRNRGEGRRNRGDRLLKGMAAITRFPALAYSRDRLLALLAVDSVSVHEVVLVIESDPALTILLLRLAKRGGPTGAGAICGIPDALTKVAPGALRQLVRDLPVFDFFGQRDAWSRAAQHFRVHAVATRCAAERLIGDGRAQKPDQLRVAALLHDIGKLVVLEAYGRYITGSERPACERVLAERRAWGLDHAVIGGEVARRLGLPNGVARLIERHHADEHGGDAALLRLADILVHYAAGHPVDRAELTVVADGSGLTGARLDAMLYGLPARPAEIRRIEPSPLTVRQTDVLRVLAQGHVYKQIAAQLGLSVSTIRSHLNAVYRRLGVTDRAQAVLVATERGWLW